MNADSREQQRAMAGAYEELRDQVKALDSSHAEPVERRLAEARDKIEKAQEEVDQAGGRKHVEDDDIARIERRMEARRASIRQHLADAKDSAARSARSLPVVALGAAGVVIAAVAIGYVVAQRASPSRRFIDRARAGPEAARRYIHHATRPPSAVWSERVATAAGVALAVVRALPQLRALATAIPRARHRA